MCEENKPNKFNWTEVYPRIAKKLLEYKAKRGEIIEFITDEKNKELFPDGITGNEKDTKKPKDDKDKKSKTPIQDIDPFSFFALFNRKINNRKEVIKAVVKFLKLEEEIKDQQIDELSFAGIPIVNNQSVLFFPDNLETEELKNHINKLWKLFEKALEDNPLNDKFIKPFDEALDLNQVTNMIASALYWIRPDVFIPFDENSRVFYYQFFLKNDNKFKDFIDTKKGKLKELRDIKFEGYKKILEKVVNIDDQTKNLLKISDKNTIATISHKAWEFDFLSELFENKNIIFYGAPGTGKTYKTLEAISLLTQNVQSKFRLIQFHPSYTYEDFIEGIKPVGINEKGQLKLELKNGHFKQFCIDVHKKNRENINNKKELDNYYFIVDEINRGNLSNIFGEIFVCLEDNYRYKYKVDDKDKQLSSLVTTQYAHLWNQKDKENIFEIRDGKVLFGIPENIYFIGMMNDVDKSIDAFDLALRRRFSWIKKITNYDVIEQELDAINKLEYIVKCKELNKYINDDLKLGSSYEFGHSFFMKIDYNKTITKAKMEELFDKHLKPTLKEYLRSVKDEKETEVGLENALKVFQFDK